MTFRRRITIVSAIAVALALTIGSVLLYLIAGRVMRTQIDDSLLRRADAMQVDRALGRQTVPPPLNTSTEDGASPAQAQVAPAPGSDDGSAGLYTQVFDLHARPSVTTAQLLPNSPPVNKVAAGQLPPFFRNAKLADGVDVRVLVTKLGPGIAVQIARPLDDTERSLAEMRMALLFVDIGGIALALLFAFLSMKVGLRPVVALSRKARSISESGDFSQRVSEDDGDELGQLGHSLNGLLDALERSLRLQRQLVADASHELRTPLTSLRTNIEVLQANEGRLPEEEKGQLLLDIVGQVEEMTALVSNLIEMAREGEQPAFEQVDLDEVIGEVVERMERLHPNQEFDVQIDPLTVEGVPSLLDRAISNLVDNAIKWSPAGQPVEIRLHGGKLTVRDYGPGIDESDRPLIFDRFYRAISARSLPGSGLGLAIVKQVADLHGASISSRTPAGGGTEMTLLFSIS